MMAVLLYQIQEPMMYPLAPGKIFLTMPEASDFDNILQEIQELRENKGQLEESFEILKNYHQKEYTAIGEALREERHRNLWRPA
ncbi:hypothetical protein CesoFtcFv8_002361 [Champsocephalus esox]|uniref:Uncharacterized protein n=1 Tax=Champsocephalus esox TaxID=159716 RepID=A0AAN8D4B8_9TELE|nr:hypothetical protein CesoFtcFv8_002361 [Champsocephalus esox]